MDDGEKEMQRSQYVHYKNTLWPLASTSVLASYLLCILDSSDPKQVKISDHE